MFLVAGFLVLLSGCFGSNARTGAGVGAVTGAGAGAIIGHQSGKGVEGAGAGAVTGSVIGGVAGSLEDATEKEAENKKKRDELLEFQKKEFDRQYRDLEDVRRQQYHDEEFRRKYGEES